MVLFVIANPDRYIVNWSCFCYFKLGQLLQINTDLLQIGPAITNQCTAKVTKHLLLCFYFEIANQTQVFLPQ